MTPEEIAAKFGVKTAPKNASTMGGGGTSPEEIAAKFLSKPIKDTPPPSKKPLGEDTSNWVDRINAAGQGASFGFADEIGSALAATAVKAGNFLTGNEGGSWGDVYSDMMDSEASKRQTFAEHNPAENLALQVAGGLFSGGAGGAKVLGTQAVKNLVKNSALKKAAAASGVGVIEGGAAGFGSTDGGFDERLEGAGTGAVVGGVLPVAIAGAGRGVKALSNRRVDQDLLDPVTGKWTPITIADKDGAAGTLYRDVVAESFGGKALKDQARPFAEQAERKVNALTKAVSRIKSGGKQKVLNSEQAIRDQADNRIGQIDQSFRAQTLEDVIPAQMPPASRALLDPENPQKTVEMLEQFWTKNGFKAAKDKVFDLDIDDFSRSLKGIFDDDPALRKEAGSYLPDIMKDFESAFIRPAKAKPRVGISSVTPPAPTQGKMLGAELMELRNKYARTANATPDGLERTAYRKIAKRIDDTLLSKLDGEELAQYKDDMARWEGFSTYGNAVGKAGNNKGGMFTQDEWLSATKNHKLKSGKGVLQEVAQAGQAQKAGLKKAISQQVKNNPVKRGLEDMTAEANRRLGTAKEASKEMQSLTGKSPNLFRTLAATGVLGHVVPFTKDVGDALFTGTGMGKALSSKTGQKIIAGQTKPQEAIAEALRKLDGTELQNFLRVAPSAAVAGKEDELDNAIFGR